MFESILITAEQTAILFVMMGVGALARVFGCLNTSSVKALTSIVVNITTPCIIVHSFQCPYDSARLPGMGWSLAMAIFWFGVGIAFSRLRYSKEATIDKPMRWAVVFSNCGFMGLPLEYALFGADGVFYGVIPIVCFNLLGWTYGVSLFRPFTGFGGLLRAFVNAATVGFVVGAVLYFLPWRLPMVIAEPIRMIGEMNTALPMFILGYYLIGAKFSLVFTIRGSYLMLILRHLIIPLMLVAVLIFCPFIPRLLKLMAIVPAAAPIGVLLTVFSIRYGGDAEFSTALVSASTLLSIITIPLVLAIARLAL